MESLLIIINVILIFYSLSLRKQVEKLQTANNNMEPYLGKWKDKRDECVKLQDVINVKDRHIEDLSLSKSDLKHALEGHLEDKKIIQNLERKLKESENNLKDLTESMRIRTDLIKNMQADLNDHKTDLKIMSDRLKLLKSDLYKPLPLRVSVDV